MEKVKIGDITHDIIGINQHGLLLEIEFSEIVDLVGKDLSIIVLYTCGDIECATLEGYTTIYKNDGYLITLSNDGSVYTVNVNMVGADGFILETQSITLDCITEFTIVKPITEFFWTPKWDFNLLQWVEGGTAPIPQTPQAPMPTQEERLEELENVILFLMME